MRIAKSLIRWPYFDLGKQSVAAVCLEEVVLLRGDGRDLGLCVIGIDEIYLARGLRSAKSPDYYADFGTSPFVASPQCCSA